MDKLAKYIGFDIDGTLLFAGDKLSTQMKHHIVKLQKLGHYVFFASGKPMQYIIDICKEFSFSPWAIVAENGGHVLLDGKEGFSLAIKDNDLKLISQRFNFNTLPPHKVEKKKSIITLCFYTMKEGREARQSLIDFIHENQLNIDVFLYDDGALDLVPEGVDKSVILNYIQADEPVMFFGDSFNDVSLISRSNVIPMAVYNSIYEIKTLALAKNGIVATHSAQRGVSEVLDLFLDIKGAAL